MKWKAPKLEPCSKPRGQAFECLETETFPEELDHATLPSQLEQESEDGHQISSQQSAFTSLTDLDIATIQVPLEPIPATSSNFLDCQNSCVSLPATKDLDGFYGFKISFPNTEGPKKQECSYSSITNKVYVVKDGPCPVHFSTDRKTPHDLFLRAMALFILPEQTADVVRRCLRHRMEDAEKGASFPEHLIHCTSSHSTYEENPISKRYSVVVPYENPQCGESFVTYIYKFTCFGSCCGGLNRRPVIVVFTLEQGGIIVGRRSVEIRICACPRRDRAADERRKERNLNQCNENKMSSLSKPGNIPAMKNCTNSPVSKKRPSSFPNQELHNAESSCSIAKKCKTSPSSQNVIMVDDVNLYIFLKNIKRIYEIYESLQNLSNLAPCLEQFLQNSSSLGVEKKSSDESE